MSPGCVGAASTAAEDGSPTVRATPWPAFSRARSTPRWSPSSSATRTWPPPTGCTLTPPRRCTTRRPPASTPCSGRRWIGCQIPRRRLRSPGIDLAGRRSSVAEHRFCKPLVRGSNPRAGSKHGRRPVDRLWTHLWTRRPFTASVPSPTERTTCAPGGAARVGGGPRRREAGPLRPRLEGQARVAPPPASTPRLTTAYPLPPNRAPPATRRGRHQLAAAGVISRT